MTARELAHALSRLNTGEDCGKFGDTCDEDCDETTAIIERAIADVRNETLEEAANEVVKTFRAHDSPHDERKAIAERIRALKGTNHGT